MHNPVIILIIVSVVLCIKESCASPDESRLYDDLLSSYHRGVRPVSEERDIVNVSLSCSLQHLQVDKDESAVTLLTTIGLRWTDYRLQWEPRDYGFVTVLRLLSDHVWMPDVAPAATLQARLDWLPSQHVSVTSAGQMDYWATVPLRVPCQPTRADGHLHCKIVFESLSHYVDTLVLTIRHLDTYDVVVQSGWRLENVTDHLGVRRYSTGEIPNVRLSLDVLRAANADSVASRPAWSALATVVSLPLCLAGYLLPAASPHKLTPSGLSLLLSAGALIAEPPVDGEHRQPTPADGDHRQPTPDGPGRLAVYASLVSVLWAVLMVVVATPRRLRLPDCLRRCLSTVCCLPPAAAPDKEQTEWSALAELLDKCAAALFLLVVAIAAAAA